MDAKNVRQWVSMFDSGWTLIFDDERIERPATVKTVDNIKRANELICEDHRIQICDTDAQMNISIGTAHDIIHRQLQFHKIAARWMSHDSKVFAQFGRQIFPKWFPTFNGKVGDRGRWSTRRWKPGAPPLFRAAFWNIWA